MVSDYASGSQTLTGDFLQLLDHRPQLPIITILYIVQGNVLGVFLQGFPGSPGSHISTIWNHYTMLKHVNQDYGLIQVTTIHTLPSTVPSLKIPLTRQQVQKVTFMEQEVGRRKVKQQWLLQRMLCYQPQAKFQETVPKETMREYTALL